MTAIEPLVRPVAENDIRQLLDSPSSGDEAPTLAHIEDALTTGYAHSMALERVLQGMLPSNADSQLMTAKAN